MYRECVPVDIAIRHLVATKKKGKFVTCSVAFYIQSCCEVRPPLQFHLIPDDIQKLLIVFTAIFVAEHLCDVREELLDPFKLIKMGEPPTNLFPVFVLPSPTATQICISWVGLWSPNPSML